MVLNPNRKTRRGQTSMIDHCTYKLCMVQEVLMVKVIFSH